MYETLHWAAAKFALNFMVYAKYVILSFLSNKTYIWKHFFLSLIFLYNKLNQLAGSESFHINLMSVEGKRHVGGLGSHNLDSQTPGEIGLVCSGQFVCLIVFYVLVMSVYIFDL